MNQYDFDTSDYAMFSVGEVYPALAEFAKPGSWRNEKPITGGQVKAHLRRTSRGGLALVKGGYRKAKRLSKATAAIAKKRGGQGLNIARTQGGRALSYGARQGGRALNVVTSNPKTSFLVAGVGAGAYALGRRKKRRR